MIDGTPVLDIKPYIPAYDTAERSIEDLSEEGKIDEGEVKEENKIGKNERADELLQRLQAGEEGIKVFKLYQDQIK